MSTVIYFWLWHSFGDRLRWIVAHEDGLRSRSKLARPYICRLIAFTTRNCAFHGASAPREGEASLDGVEVFAQAVGETADPGDGSGARLGDPVFELCAAALADQ